MGQGRHTLRSVSDPVYPRFGVKLRLHVVGYQFLTGVIVHYV